MTAHQDDPADVMTKCPHCRDEMLYWQADDHRCKFSLTIGTDVELVVVARHSGRKWNGFDVPVLTADQAALVGTAIGESDSAAGESDGLQWEVVRQ